MSCSAFESQRSHGPRTPSATEVAGRAVNAASPGAIRSADCQTTSSRIAAIARYVSTTCDSGGPPVAGSAPLLPWRIIGSAYKRASSAFFEDEHRAVTGEGTQRSGEAQPQAAALGSSTSAM